MARKTLTQQLAEAKQTVAALEAENNQLSKNQGYKYGALITDCVFNNKSSPINKHAAKALMAAAYAAQANAEAIQEIAKSAKGIEANMQHGIHLSHIGVPE